MKGFNADKFSMAVTLKRQFFGLTRREVAEITGLHDVTIGKIERGETLPDLLTFIRVCEWLELDMSQFIIEVKNAKSTD